MESQIEINDKYAKKIQELKSKVKDLKPVLDDFEKYYTGLITKNFFTQGKVFTSGWKPLSQKWLRRKKRLVEAGVGKRMEILRFKDILRKKATKEGVKVLKDKIEYKVVLPYANVHQFGYKKIPSRPYLFAEGGLQNKDKLVFYKILEKYLTMEQQK